MPELDPAAYDNIFSVLALAIVVLGAVAMKWLSTMKRENTETKDQVDRLVTSVTQNGGSSVKDYLDRLETKLDEHLTWSDGFAEQTEQRLAKLEAPRRRRLTKPKATGTQMARPEKESPH